DRSALRASPFKAAELPKLELELGGDRLEGLLSFAEGISSHVNALTHQDVSKLMGRKLRVPHASKTSAEFLSIAQGLKALVETIRAKSKELSVLALMGRHLRKPESFTREKLLEELAPLDSGIMDVSVHDVGGTKMFFVKRKSEGGSPVNASLDVKKAISAAKRGHSKAVGHLVTAFRLHFNPDWSEHSYPPLNGYFRSAPRLPRK
ncbi:MAG TPA: hypothetical protein VJI71_00350, partial [Candidatus Norongarragalinales archaeon]|nr:hypothetical protein [Candidatus Norongarragalinales archaeon]